jgi:hypothetical protein
VSVIDARQLLLLLLSLQRGSHDWWACVEVGGSGKVEEGEGALLPTESPCF